MTLYFEGRAVAEIRTDAEGRLAGLRYDPRWLATPGAFPVSLSLPLVATEVFGPAAAEWGRRLTLDGGAPFEERLDRGPTVALFGALTLQRSAAFGSEPDAPDAVERRIRAGEVGEGEFERIAFLRSLAALAGVAITAWRRVETGDGPEIRLRRADRIEKDGRVRRPPLDLVAFGRAPLRSTTLFRRLDGALDAADRLQLFDRIVFSALVGVDAPSAALRLDGRPRLAPVGADWTGGVGGARLCRRGLAPSAWCDFARAAGLNKTFAPRRAAAMAADLALLGVEAVRRAAAASPELRWPILDYHRRRLEERLERAVGGRLSVGA